MMIEYLPPDEVDAVSDLLLIAAIGENNNRNDDDDEQQVNAAIGENNNRNDNDDEQQDVVAAPHHRGRQRRGITVRFPENLFDMLTTATTEGFDHIVSWHPHGRSFLIHNENLFVRTVMLRFFDQTKIASFQRQLSIYGFVRLSTGSDRAEYYHELFLRARPMLCRRIVRICIKVSP